MVLARDSVWFVSPLVGKEASTNVSSRLLSYEFKLIIDLLTYDTVVRNLHLPCPMQGTGYYDLF